MARQSRQPSGTGIYQRSKVKRNTSKGRPSDNQVVLLIKEKTGVTNSSAFQQLPEETKRSVLIELKGMRASLRQLERLTGIGKSMIFRM